MGVRQERAQNHSCEHTRNLALGEQLLQEVDTQGGRCFVLPVGHFLGYVQQ